MIIQAIADRSSIGVGLRVAGLVSMFVNIAPDRWLSISNYSDMLRGMTRARATSLDPDVRLLAALADPTRLAIVRQLASEAETCACDFTSCCEVGQPTVSHHLRVLREAGIVSAERRGQWIFYRLEPSTAERLGALARGFVPGGLVTVGDLLATRGSSAGSAGAARADA
jgi:DNA-binding transcriptional ArsR family regulator